MAQARAPAQYASLQQPDTTHDAETGEGPVYDFATGLPVISEEEKDSAFWKGLAVLPVFMIVPRLLGLGIAYGLYKLNHETYDGAVAKLKDLNGDLGYLYIAGALLAVLTGFLNMFPTVYKGQVMPFNAGNLRSNMLIYKVNKIRGDQLPYVVMEEEDEVGMYNRANRALHQFNENIPGTLACVLLSGLIFAKPVAALMAVYVLARAVYQVAYSVGGYGKHAIPFAIHSMLVAPVFEMFCWLAAVLLLR